jgi:hypothetical protein
MKYQKSKSLSKAILPALPFLASEIFGIWKPEQKEAAMAIGIAVVMAWASIGNWLKNRHRVA